MQQFKSTKKIQLTILSLLVISGVSYADSIGDIVESTGLSSLTRQTGEEFVVSPSYIPSVELFDRAETKNGRLLIEFLDKSELALTEHTRVIIDEVIYDPNPDKSKMVMKFAFGTARFASGVTGQINKNNIDISTPTAQIAVRGTNFTTTIDELGRSLVILLPDEFGDPSGTIVVSNNAGEVTLDQAYAATMVSSLDSTPTATVTINNPNKPPIIDGNSGPRKTPASKYGNVKLRAAKIANGTIDKPSVHDLFLPKNLVIMITNKVGINIPHIE